VGCSLSGDERFEIERRGRPALLALDEGGTQSGESGFLFLKQPESCPYYIAGAAVAAFAYLRLDEVAEMLTDAERRVFSHDGYPCLLIP
jgi:hypothetical protein